MYIANIPANVLHVDIGKIPLVYVPKISKIIVRHRMGMILLNIDGRVVELNTLTAHRIGLAIARSKLAPDEMIILIINGERVELPKPFDTRVSTALLRKADDADDWQINRSKSA